MPEVLNPDLINRACKSRAYQELKEEFPRKDGLLRSILKPTQMTRLESLMEAAMEGSIDPDILNREGGFGIDSDFRYSHPDPDALNAGLRYLLLLSWRYQSEMNSGAESHALHPSVRRALAFLSEQDENESLESLAKRCGVSAAYLSRIFRRQVGIPLSQYRNSLRLGRFWESYSQETSRTLTEAVFAAGFGSYAQFYRVFREAYGRGPRDVLN